MTTTRARSNAKSMLYFFIVCSPHPFPSHWPCAHSFQMMNRTLVRRPAPPVILGRIGGSCSISTTKSCRPCTWLGGSWMRGAEVTHEARGAWADVPRAYGSESPSLSFFLFLATNTTAATSYYCQRTNRNSNDKREWTTRHYKSTPVLVEAPRLPSCGLGMW